MNNATMAMLAYVLPKEEIMKRIREAMDEYELCPTDDNYELVISMCALLMLKTVMKDKTPDEVADEMEKFDARNKMFETHEN